MAAFYDRRPFPGYGPDDDATTLLDRVGRAPFLRALDAAAPTEGPVLDAGCGTGQTAACLALLAARRATVGLDLSEGALAEAARFRDRARLGNLALVRGDLLRAPFREGSFPFVVSRGVVHHAADPWAALDAVAKLVAPGGLLVLGYYDRAARAFHTARVAWARRRGRPWERLDPILRRRDLAPAKRDAWIADQYEHPVESRLALKDVAAALRRAGFRWVRSVPPAGSLDAPKPPPEGLRRFALELGWFLRGFVDPDAGLVAVVARRAR